MCSCTEKCKPDRCRIAVTIEDNSSGPCRPGKFFDIVIRSRDGKTTASGKVPSGGSETFDLPGCDTSYTVTATGDAYSSPRAQTRRVLCCCGVTSGVTFIFETFTPDCEENRFPKPCFPCKPCPPPCPAPCPPPPKPPCNPCASVSSEEFSNPIITFTI